MIDVTLDMMLCGMWSDGGGCHPRSARHSCNTRSAAVASGESFGLRLHGSAAAPSTGTRVAVLLGVLGTAVLPAGDVVAV
jgi:hypothetical protein